MSEQAKAVASALPAIGHAIADRLEDIAGAELLFVLVVKIDDRTLFLSNGTRAEGTDLLEAVFARWQARRAAGAAPYDPELDDR